MKQMAMVHIKVCMDEHEFTFEMPVGAPIGKAYDAAHQVLQQILVMAKNASDSAKSEMPQE